MLSVWLVILMAIGMANLPFFSERVFGVFPWRYKTLKPVWCRLLEALIGYGLVGLLAYGLERSRGNVFEQGWAFYAITLCLFISFTYPGVVFRYLRKQKPQ